MMTMKTASVACALTALLAACGGVSSLDPNALVSSGTTLYKAAALSDSDILQVSNEACAASDKQSKVAVTSSTYAKRLAHVMGGFGDMTLNGQKINYKVYMTRDVNAWAMGNGCVRVYSGLMDMMNDDELRGVIGHEMGHVALGHSKKALQTAYAVSAARTAAGAAGNSAVVALSSSQLGDLTEKFINAQFSQSQESAADDFSFDLLKQKKFKESGLVTAFQKLSKLDGGNSSMLSSHPSSPSRAAHIQARIDKEG
jgi:putative metalloprotease